MDQGVVLIQAAYSEDTIYLSSYIFLLRKQVHRILREPLPENINNWPQVVQWWASNECNCAVKIRYPIIIEQLIPSVASYENFILNYKIPHGFFSIVGKFSTPKHILEWVQTLNHPLLPNPLPLIMQKDSE